MDELVFYERILAAVKEERAAEKIRRGPPYTMVNPSVDLSLPTNVAT